MASSCLDCIKGSFDNGKVLAGYMIPLGLTVLAAGMMTPESVGTFGEREGANVEKFDSVDGSRGRRAGDDVETEELEMVADEA